MGHPVNNYSALSNLSMTQSSKYSSALADVAVSQLWMFSYPYSFFRLRGSGIFWGIQRWVSSENELGPPSSFTTSSFLHPVISGRRRGHQWAPLLLMWRNLRLGTQRWSVEDRVDLPFASVTAPVSILIVSLLSEVSLCVNVMDAHGH